MAWIFTLLLSIHFVFYVLNCWFSVLPFSFVYQTVGVLVRHLKNWGSVSGRANICLLPCVWTGSGVHSVCIHWILVYYPWVKVDGCEGKMLGKNGAVVSPFPTCLILSVVHAWFIEDRNVLTLRVPNDYILCMTCIWSSSWSQHCSFLLHVPHFGNTLEALVLWYVFLDGEYYILGMVLWYWRSFISEDTLWLWQSLPLDPVLIHFMLIHICSIYLYNFFNIIIHCVLRSCEWSLPVKISNQNVACDVSSWWACFLSVPHLITKTVVVEEGKLWSPTM